MVSLMLDNQLYGLNPGGYHLTNVLLHAATTVLLFLVLRRDDGEKRRVAPLNPQPAPGRRAVAQRVCGGGVCPPSACGWNRWRG